MILFSKAVFRGVFREYSSYSAELEEVPTIITEDNWQKLGRGRLQHLGWTRSDIFDIAVKVEGEHRKIFDGYVNQLPTNYWMSSLEQAVTYRHVIYAEGWCGWADRLKTLLMYGSTIFLQKTPCHEYYQDLMQPYVHYVPVDGIFSDLPKQVEWGRSNQKEAALIANNSAKLAKKYLTSKAIKCYMEFILHRYISLFNYKPSLRPKAVRWSPQSQTKEDL